MYPYVKDKKAGRQQIRGMLYGSAGQRHIEKLIAKTTVNSETTFAFVPGKENDPMQLFSSDGDDKND